MPSPLRNLLQNVLWSWSFSALQTQFNQTPREELPGSLRDIPKDTPIMMYCTGGIRCDVYSPVLRQQGFSNLYTLHGGIANYLRQLGPSHWKGSMFTFDNRLAVAPGMGYLRFHATRFEKSSTTSKSACTSWVMSLWQRLVSLSEATVTTWQMRHFSSRKTEGKSWWHQIFWSHTSCMSSYYCTTELSKCHWEIELCQNWCPTVKSYCEFGCSSQTSFRFARVNLVKEHMQKLRIDNLQMEQSWVRKAWLPPVDVSVVATQHNCLT